MGAMGAARKAVIFTESRRTQDYLARYLEAHGYAGKVTQFSGGNQGPASTGIYQRWLAQYTGSDRVTGSPPLTAAPRSSTTSAKSQKSLSPPKLRPRA